MGNYLLLFTAIISGGVKNSAAEWVKFSFNMLLIKISVRHMASSLGEKRNLEKLNYKVGEGKTREKFSLSRDRRGRGETCAHAISNSINH